MSPVIGVSPAYFISRFGDRFTVQQVTDAMVDIAAMGYQRYQLEIYHADSLKFWLAQGARRVRESAISSGLGATQFVAHFLLHAFADPERLNSDQAIEQMKQVLDIVQQFDECRIITVPMGIFTTQTPVLPGNYHRMLDQCLVKIERLLRMVEATDRRMALEVMPGSLIGGIDGFLNLCRLLKSPTLGFNLDTGHAWAAKENIYLIPAKLGHRILGTHLCDNFGHKNASFRPGAGSIDWCKMISALMASDYAGSYDVEIICASREIHREYGQGYKFIHKILDQKINAIGQLSIA